MRIYGSFLTRAFVALAVLMAIALPVAAQAPTAEQLQIFQGLTPEQQQALLEQLETEAATADMNSADLAAPNGDRTAQGTDDAGGGGAATPTTKVPVLGAGDYVVLDATVRGSGPDEVPGQNEMEQAGALAALVLSRNPYVLDRRAQLNLPGFAPIAMGGLTDKQATQRLAAEPALGGLDVKVTRLPLDLQVLKPFGYEFFTDASSKPVPNQDVPVPVDYVVGAGDRFRVQLYGNQSRNLQMVVNRDGFINFPELGPIEVAGMTFSAARRAIESLVGQQLIGVRVDVSLSDARGISVFVLGGGARRPGSYTVSGLANMTTALFASGGVNDIGSLRDIQLKRQGEVIRHLDLYDMLIGGDTSDDAKLLPGDVIFIPTVGSTVSIDGEVRRPAIYELLGENSVADLLRIAGGLTPEADLGRTSLMRIDAGSRRVVLDVNLADAAGLGLNLRNGDALHVSSLRPQLDAGVTLAGFVHRPGSFAWREGMRLTDLIASVDELKPGADQHYVLIRREGGPERRVTLLSADLTAALAAPGSVVDPQLSARDQITVFDLAPGRERIIQPLLDELRLQSDLSRPTQVVSIKGRVKVPGEYPLEPGMRVADLLRAGGNLEPEAYGGTAELTRYRISADGSRQTELLTVNLAALRSGDAAANLELQPYDYLLVQETPDWGGQQTVTLRGEVRFPGTYPIRRGETLREVLDRAGGLTSQAFPEGSAFTRRDLKLLEQQQLDRLAENLRGDLVALSMQAARAGQANSGDALLAGQSLLSQLQAAKATGRFVIDLPGLLASGVSSDKDVLVRDGDELFIPKKRQEVTVIGEIQNATSHLYLRELQRADYIKMSGGTTRRADKTHIYVVRADGSVATDKAMRPGDTIVVPMDAERMPRLPFWQAVTQILYNVAVSVAAVNSF